ncbi:MAG: hypothetical protein J4G11_12645 [Acidimicrobiia bacterium]|nr:hypothetical protein [Acidimicrobiia bacterium]
MTTLLERADETPHVLVFAGWDHYGQVLIGPDDGEMLSQPGGSALAEQA